jgi:hypothetical protein
MKKLFTFLFLLTTLLSSAQSWVNTGTAGFSAGGSNNTCIATDGTTPYVFFLDQANGFKGSVMKFNGTAWVYVGTPGFTANQVPYSYITMDGSTPYVAYRDAGNSNKATVMKFNGTSWVSVGPVGFSAGQADDICLTINSGTPYIAYRDYSNAQKTTVMKFDGTNWVAVGAAGLSAGAAYNNSLVFDGTTPYVGYYDNTLAGRATVKKFDGTNWIAVGAAGFSAGGASWITMAFSGSTLYIGYQDGANGNKTTVKKFDGTNWVTVGTVGFSTGASQYNKLVFNGITPYVAYQDITNGQKANVMKFDGTNWVNVGTAGFSAGIAEYTGLAFIGNTPYVVYRDAGNGQKVTVMQFSTAATGLNFDGANDYINCGNNPVLNVTSSLSVEAWINRSVSGTDDCIIGKDVFANGTGYAFWVYQNNKLTLRFSNREFIGTATIPTNTWTHVAATYNASTNTIKLYINGVVDATFTGVAVPVSNTSNLYIGTPQDAVANATYAFSGSLDEVRIWDRELVQSEIQNNMSCEMNPAGQTGLLALYHFNQGYVGEANAAVTTATDASSNINTGTLTNFGLTGATSNWAIGNATGNCNLAAGGLNLDGSNDYISISHNNIFNSINLTVQAWIKTATNDAGSRGIVNKYYSSTGNGWNVFLLNGQVNAWYFGAGSSITNLVSPLTVSDNALHEVSFTVDNAGGKLFIDGVLSATQVWSAAPAATTTAQNISIGLYPAADQTTAYFIGNIDEVKIWNRTLCQSEIQNNLNGELNPVLQTGLKGYYKLNQGFLNSNNAGITTARDHSGNNFTGTLNNFALTGAVSNWAAGMVTGTASVFAPASLAGTAGGAQVCQSATIQTPGTNYLDGSCNLIAAVNPSGVSPLTGTVNTCVKIDASVQTYNTQPYVQRHYDITPATNPSTATGTVTLYFTQAEFNAYNAVRGTKPALPTSAADATGIAKLIVTQFHGTGTAPGNYSGASEVINPVDANIVFNSTLSRWQVKFDVNGFSGFYVHTNGINAALPLTLISFSGKNNGVTKLLQWVTSNEVNLKEFVVERGNDISNFKSIGTVNAKGFVNNTYDFTDTYNNEGVVYYRLRLVDNDGKFSYSNIISLLNKADGTVTVYPNPIKNKATLQINDRSLMNTAAKITDINGRTVQTFIIKNNVEVIDMSILPAGMYLLQTANGGNKKLIKE